MFNQMIWQKISQIFNTCLLSMPYLRLIVQSDLGTCILNFNVFVILEICFNKIVCSNKMREKNPGKENEQSCIGVLEVSILPLSAIFIFDFRTVPTVWYFGTVLTVWYFGTVPTVWYFGTVPTVWYFGTVPTVWYFGNVSYSVVFWKCSYCVVF